MESIKESEALEKERMLYSTDNKFECFNTMQVIQIGARQFDFFQDDPIFTLSHSPFIKELGLQPIGDETNLKKKLLALIPDKLPSCFCCGKEVWGAAGTSKKIKVEACHFCTKWGCEDCVVKSFPFAKVLKGQSEAQRGRICRVCETKFYIKNVILSLITSSRNLTKFSGKQKKKIPKLTICREAFHLSRQKSQVESKKQIGLKMKSQAKELTMSISSSKSDLVQPK